MLLRMQKIVAPALGGGLACLILGMLFFGSDWLASTDHTKIYHLLAEYSDLGLDQVLKLPKEDWQQKQVNDLITNHSSRPSWFRVSIKNPSTQTIKRTISLIWPHLSSIHHYTFKGSKLVRSGHTGTEAESPSPVREGPFFSFEYEIGPGKVLDVFFKTESLFLQRIVVHVGKPADVKRSLRLLTLGLGFCVGGLICLAFYNLLLSLSLRESVYLYTSMFFLSNALIDSAFWYFPGLSIYQGEAQKAGLFVVYAINFASLSSLLVTREILTKELSELVSKIFAILILANLANVGLAIFLNLSTAFYIVSILGGICGTLCLSSAAFLLRKHADAKYILVFFIALYAAVMVLIAENFGLLDAKMSHTTMLGVSQLLSAILLSIVVANRITAMLEEKMVIRDALFGKVPETVLNSVLESPQSLDLRAKECHVTIMFIDIVGFSKSSQKMSPANTFEHLKSCLAGITEIINDCGGTVDRLLGDGVLCFFGYSVDGRTNDDHAGQAFQAARNIQDFSLRYIIEQTREDEAPFPLRVGIHTEKVFLGNLGDRNRIDYTMVGNGVNFAARLESACNPFRIMLSQPSKDLLNPKLLGDGVIHPIKISLKHYKNEVLAYEFSDAKRHGDNILLAEQRYWQYLGRFQKDLRVPIPESAQLWIDSNLGRFLINDLSQKGFGASGSQFLGRNVTFQGKICSEAGSLQEKLIERSLHILTISVRWGRFTKGSYKHGLEFVGLNIIQRNYIFEAVTEAFQLDLLGCEAKDPQVVDADSA